MTDHALLRWDEEAADGEPLTYEQWEDRRDQKTAACLLALQRIQRELAQGVLL